MSKHCLFKRLPPSPSQATLFKSKMETITTRAQIYLTNIEPGEREACFNDFESRYISINSTKCLQKFHRRYMEVLKRGPGERGEVFQRLLRVVAACNGGSSWGIYYETFACETILRLKPRVQASSSSIPRLRIPSIVMGCELTISDIDLWKHRGYFSRHGTICSNNDLVLRHTLV